MPVSGQSNRGKFIAGVDGCKNGWVIVSETHDGYIAVDVVSDFQRVLDCKYDLVVIDIPIGLLEGGTRLADQEARRLLKRRACCVFTAPLRPMLTCTDYLAARQCRLGIEGKALTTQAWAIIPRIIEVDRLLTIESQSQVKEGHPEVSFAHMNSGDVLASSKHKIEGRRLRLSLLARHFPDVTLNVEKHSRIAEDVIDAYAMLWTAQRIRHNRALALPERAPSDARGLLMQIWA